MWPLVIPVESMGEGRRYSEAQSDAVTRQFQPDFLLGTGEMRKRIRDFNWWDTPVGPIGSAHLPINRTGVAGKANQTSTAVRAGIFTGEALTWIAERDVTEPASVALVETGKAAARRSRMVLADDNSDMRAHVAHILGPQYDLVAVPHGRTALEEARRQSPDLVLADIMMPRLGRRLRACPTPTLPLPRHRFGLLRFFLMLAFLVGALPHRAGFQPFLN